MYSKFIGLILRNSANGEKNLKLQLCRQHFLVEALSVIEPPNIVPPSENAVGTAVILDFMSDFKNYFRKCRFCSIPDYRGSDYAGSTV